MQSMSILVVDDDADMVDILTFALKRNGYAVVGAHDPATALRMLDRQPIDFALLDVNLKAPGDGFDLLKAVRERSRIPVMMLTGRGAEEDRVNGLDLGADDYLPKPFSHHELISRIEAVSRRTRVSACAAPPRQQKIQAGPFSLDLAGHRATRNGECLNLTVTEFRLLHVLMQHPDTVLPNGTLLQEVWGCQQGSSDVVRVAAYRLRHKIEEDPTNPCYLHSISGVGFVLRTAA